MVSKATNSGTERRAAVTGEEGGHEKAQQPRRTRRKKNEGVAKPDAASAAQPRPAASQSKPADAPPAAEPQRPSAEVAGAADESTFEANMRAAGHVAGQAFGVARDTILKGADAVNALTTEEGVKKVTDAAKDVAGRNKGVVVAGAALVLGGLPAVAVTVGALARGAKLVLVDGEDPVAAGKQVYAEANQLADKAAALPSQAGEIAGQAKEALSGWAARLGFGKSAAKTDENKD